METTQLVSLEFAQKLTFIFRHTTQEIDVSETDNMSIMMIPDLTQLEEVVVVGYGSVLKKDLTGALSTVEVEDEVANQSIQLISYYREELLGFKLFRTLQHLVEVSVLKLEEQIA